MKTIILIVLTLIKAIVLLSGAISIAKMYIVTSEEEKAKRKQNALKVILKLFLLLAFLTLFEFITLKFFE